MSIRKPFFFVFTLAAIFAQLSFLQNDAFAAKQSPQAAWQKAQAQYRKLLSNKKKRMLRTPWELCIARFDKLASSSPDKKIARLAQFSKAEALEGLYKVSRVQSDRDQAAKAYGGCVKDYPDTTEATKAQARLKAMGMAPTPTLASGLPSPAGGEGNKEPDIISDTHTPPLPPMGHLAEPKAPKMKRGDAPEHEGRGEGENDGGAGRKHTATVAASTNKPVHINEIRHWSNMGYTRVVIDMDGEAPYSSRKLKNPDRLFFDLKGARIPKNCKGGDADVDDGILHKIRASQFDADTVRVVLDLASIASSRTLMLQNPTRLIIDVTGKEQRTPGIKLARTGRHGRGGRSTGGRMITLRPVNDLGTAPPLVEKENKQVVAESAETIKPAEVQAEVSSESSVVASEPTAAERAVAPEKEAPTHPTSLGSPSPAGGEGNKEGENAAVAPNESAAKAPELDEEKVLDSAPFPNATTAAPVNHKQTSAYPAPKMCIGTIVIDPGHGGKDTGAIGKNGHYEKDVVLDIGLKLRDIIKENYACKVVMTRDRDVFIDLDARPGIAVQNDADLFISIHANASKSPSARGIETYLLNLTKDRNIMEVAARENLTTIKNMGSLDIILKDLILDSKRDESLKLAHAVQASLVSDMRGYKVNDKGVKQGPFLVLYGASMPSILTEVGFITNPEEEARLADPNYRRELAQAIFDGIKEYLGQSRIASLQKPK